MSEAAQGIDVGIRDIALRTPERKKTFDIEAFVQKIDADPESKQLIEESLEGWLVPVHALPAPNETTFDKVIRLRSYSPTYFDAAFHTDCGMGRLRRAGLEQDQVALQRYWGKAGSLKEAFREMFEAYGTPVSEATRGAIFKRVQQSAQSHAGDFTSPLHLADLIEAALKQKMSSQQAEQLYKDLRNVEYNTSWYQDKTNTARQRFQEGLDKLQEAARGEVVLSGERDDLQDVRQTKIESTQTGPTFESMAGAVWELVQKDRHARAVFAFLSAKFEDWKVEGLDGAQGLADKIDEQKVKTLLLWVKFSPDFASLAEFRGVVEEGLKGLNEADDYRRARDEVVDLIRPHFTLEKHPDQPLNTILSTWERSYDNFGKAALQDKQEMLRNHAFVRLPRAETVFYVPTEFDLAKLDRFVRINKSVAQVLGGEGTKRAHVLIVPEARYCPRGGYAQPSGRDVLLAGDDPQIERVYTHERVHEELGQLFGSSASFTASEGAAMFISKLLDPNDPRNDYLSYQYGVEEIEHADRHSISVGFSHTQALEGTGYKGKLNDKNEYEFAYKFGGFLMEYLYQKVGTRGVLEFYKKTCQQQFFDKETGKPLIHRGMRLPGVREREINVAALKSVSVLLGRPDLQPNVVEAEFDRYIKDRQMRRQ